MEEVRASLKSVLNKIVNVCCSSTLNNQIGILVINTENMEPIQNTDSVPAISLSGNNANRTLWIGDCPKDWPEDKLTEIFTECNHPPYKVKRVVFKGELQGYCFIEFKSFEEARNALYNLNGNRIPGNGKHRFNLCFANDTYNQNSEHNLHVSNVPTELSDAELYRVFDKYFSCRGAKMFRFSDGTSKGSGFVRFGDQTEQQMALVEMSRTRVHSKQISLKLAGPRGERNDRSSYSRDNYKKEDSYKKNNYNRNQPARQVLDAFGQPIKTVEPDIYGVENPWAILPDENDLDPIIKLDFLPAKYRPQTTNKRYMIDSEQMFLDLESSRWSTVVMPEKIKEEDFEKMLSSNRLSYD